ncbi:unnamed protein product, partial [Owenia fusiformis]
YTLEKYVKFENLRMEVTDYDGYDAILPVLSITLMWSTIYLTLCIVNPTRTYEWQCRIVTLLHAVSMVAVCGWCAFIQGPWPFTDPGGPNTQLQHMACMLSLGYFLFDFTWCIFSRTEGAIMMIHHLVSVLGLSMTVYRGIYGTEMIGTLFGTEISNPFLQIRWFFS